MAAIIFDFDGTIVDSFDFVADFLERHVRRGHPLTPDEKQTLRGMTMHQMARHLGSRDWQLPMLFIAGRWTMGQTIYSVPLFAGMSKVIEQLHHEGHSLYIVSSNNPRNIRKSLKQHHLYKYFTVVRGNAGFFGKQRAIRKLIRRNSLSLKDSVYIGDEARDVVSAKAAGVKVIAVTWGFDQANILASHQPDALAHVPQDIVRALEVL